MRKRTVGPQSKTERRAATFFRVSLNLVVRVQRLQRANWQSEAAPGAVRVQWITVSSSVTAFPHQMLGSSFCWYWYTKFLSCPPVLPGWWVNWYWSGWKQSSLSLMLHDKFAFSAEIKQSCFSPGDGELWWSNTQNDSFITSKSNLLFIDSFVLSEDLICVWLMMRKKGDFQALNSD